MSGKIYDIARCLTCGADPLPIVCASCAAAELAAERERAGMYEAALAQSEAQCAQLRAALRQHGTHGIDCPAFGDDGSQAVRVQP